MKYVYPKLSKKDFHLFRIGGAGLGNILFTYARAVVYAQKNPDTRVIWPTWFSIKIGTILRGEKDKRFYNDLFKNRAGHISGLKKSILWLTKKKISEKQALAGEDREDKIIVFEDFEDCFEPIMNDSELVYEDIVKNLANKNKKALDFDASDAICMHVRLGDFNRVTWEELLAGKNNSSIPIEWYVKMGEQIREIVGRPVKIYVFSDGTDEELKQLLDMENVERITFGTAIADIIGLSKAGIFVASGSSFSMWARYLGRMTTIMLPNQQKQQILQSYDEGKEILALERISEEYFDTIKSAIEV